MIRAPSATDAYELCDWAEVAALRSGRHATTQGDLIKVIQPDDSRQDDPGADDDESMNDEQISDDVLGIADVRARLLGESYPFVVETKSVRVRPGRYNRSGEAYLFHLLLTTLEASFIDLNIRHHFELESMTLLSEYFGGEKYHFGWTLHNASRGAIQARVEDFCNASRLGWAARRPVAVSAGSKDIGIDALLWRRIADQRSNFLVFILQCASGHNWRAKLETSAARLLEDCIEGTRNGPWVTSFCTPFHIPDKLWHECARRHDGLLLDRLRLVLLTKEAGARRIGCLRRPECRSWLGTTLGQLMNGGGKKSPASGNAAPSARKPSGSTRNQRPVTGTLRRGRT